MPTTIKNKNVVVVNVTVPAARKRSKAARRKTPRAASAPAQSSVAANAPKKYQTYSTGGVLMVRNGQPLLFDSNRHVKDAATNARIDAVIRTQTEMALKAQQTAFLASLSEATSALETPEVQREAQEASTSSEKEDPSSVEGMYTCPRDGCTFTHEKAQSMAAHKAAHTRRGETYPGQPKRFM
jgi:hypothetical protein